MTAPTITGDFDPGSPEFQRDPHTVWAHLFGPPRFPMHYDPPQQTHYRRIMNAPFLADNVASLEARFRENTVALLRALLNTQGGEAVSSFTSPLPTLNLKCPGATLSRIELQIALEELLGSNPHDRARRRIHLRDVARVRPDATAGRTRASLAHRGALRRAAQLD